MIPMKGELAMTAQDRYKTEAKEKWGKTDAYREYEEKTKPYSQDRWAELAGDMQDIFAAFAVCRNAGKTPDSSDAQSLVKRLQTHITQNYYRCTNEILAGLGQMYVLDERFKHNIDQNAEGTAAFVREAINAFCGV